MERHKSSQKTNPVEAIRENCIECMGGRGNTGYDKLIEGCASKECNLFAFRFGNNPYRKERKLSEPHKKAFLHSRVNKKPPENPSTRTKYPQQFDYL